MSTSPKDRQIECPTCKAKIGSLCIWGSNAIEGYSRQEKNHPERIAAARRAREQLTTARIAR